MTKKIAKPKPAPKPKCPMCGGTGGYYDVCDYHITERGC